MNIHEKKRGSNTTQNKIKNISDKLPIYEDSMKFETKAIHVGEEPDFRDGGSGDVVMAIHLTATFARQKVDTPTNGYDYSRTGNPTRNALETRLSLEFPI